MSPPLAPIGTSMIQFIDHDDDDDGGMSSAMDVVDVEMPSTSTRTTQPISPPPPPPPCLLLPHTDPSNPSPSILLQGPPKSGKTSLALDLAYAMACSAPCRCQDASSSSASCTCVAATLFLQEEESPSSSSISSSKNEFPLFCRPVQDHQHHSHNHGLNFPTLPNDPDPQRQEIASSLSSSSSLLMLDPKWLRRIQIQYVSSARQVLHYLLTIPGKPLTKQPIGAILIDDLDFLTNHQLAPMMQTLALLVDTSHVLGRIHGACPTVLATTTTNTSSGAGGSSGIHHHHHSNIATAVPWMSTRIQLVQQQQQQSTTSTSTGTSVLQESSSCSWLPKDKEYQVVGSHWKAERQTMRDGEPPSSNNNNNNKEIVEYVVTKTRDSDTMEIQWKRPPPTPPT